MTSTYYDAGLLRADLDAALLWAYTVSDYAYVRMWMALHPEVDAP